MRRLNSGMVCNFVLIINLLTIPSCRKESPLSILTLPVSDITSVSAVSGIKIINFEENELVKCGICWSNNPDPTFEDNKMYVKPEQGFYTMTMADLTPNTLYFVRSFAFYSGGTCYGDEIAFITSPVQVLPATIITIEPELSETTVLSGGFITSEGGGPISLKGICWADTPNPTINHNLVIFKDYFGTDDFVCGIRSGLMINTTYYLRALAVNSAGISYGNEISFTLWLDSPGPDVIDIDGNRYTSVKIGTQTWMKNNLKTTSFNDGTAIPDITDDIEWDTITKSAYCWYNNDEASFRSDYGALYNFYSISSGKLCPAGWHMPTLSEFETLKSYLDPMAGAKTKECGISHWLYPNIATNESGFTALPGGIRGYWPSGNTSFRELGKIGIFWGTPDTANSQPDCLLWLDQEFGNFNLANINTDKNIGGSVRCVKD